jgi:hypothetical protein
MSPMLVEVLGPKWNILLETVYSTEALSTEVLALVNKRLCTILQAHT